MGWRETEKDLWGVKKRVSKAGERKVVIGRDRQTENETHSIVTVIVCLSWVKEAY